MNEPRISSREPVFATPWFTVVAKRVEAEPGGDSSPFYSLALADYVTVLAVTPDGKVPLVRQYRPAPERFMLELPSGAVNPGEDPAATATRELFEETGFEARHVTLLGTLVPDTGRLGNRLWGFLIETAASTAAAGWQPEAGIEVQLHDRSELPLLIAGGDMLHALDLAVIALSSAKS